MTSLQNGRFFLVLFNWFINHLEKGACGKLTKINNSTKSFRIYLVLSAVKCLWDIYSIEWLDNKMADEIQCWPLQNNKYVGKIIDYIYKQSWDLLAITIQEEILLSWWVVL